MNNSGINYPHFEVLSLKTQFDPLEIKQYFHENMLK